MTYSLYCSKTGVLSEHATLLNNPLRLIAQADSADLHNVASGLSHHFSSFGVSTVPNWREVDTEVDKLARIALFLCDISRESPGLALASKLWIFELINEISETVDLYKAEISPAVFVATLYALEALARALEEKSTEPS